MKIDKLLSDWQPDLFNYKRWLKPICEKLTNHKHNSLVLWPMSFVENGYKYPNRHDFYYKCNICGYVFFNHKISEENIKKTKEKMNNE